MTDRTDGETETQRAGDRRQEDRRQWDRRRGDRRSAPPLWRRPWAYVGYGVAGALALVLLLTSLGDEQAGDAAQLEVTTGMAPPETGPAGPAATAPVQDAYAVGDFERLLAEGAGAVGQRVRTVLFCEAPRLITLRDVDRVSPAVAEVADAGRRVPGAECNWGTDPNAPDLLLLIPPGLAEQFAAAPEVQQGFIVRRRVPAELEWVGRSEALALRTVGVLRGIREQE